MATVMANLTELLKDVPAGAWVAISEQSNTVVAFGADLQEVVRESSDKGEAHPLIVRVPEQQTAMFF